MAKITLDLNRFKASGVYTIEFDASERIVVTTQTIRLVVGFSRKGPFNAPVFLRDVATSRKVFGEVDSFLEKRGSFFHRAIETCLQTAPVFGLNLLPLNNIPVNEGGDAVDYRSFAIAANESNGNLTRALLSSFYNKERFWFPDEAYLQATVDSKPANRGRLFNFVNLGQEVQSIIVRKSDNASLYNITADDYYGRGNVPPYIQPNDYLSDYFVDVYVVKGDWTNLQLLSQDPTYSKYFDLRGIKTSNFFEFLSLDGVTMTGSFTGTIIPDFIDNNGSNQSIDVILNSAVALTGVFCNLNKQAFDDYDNSLYKVDMVGNSLINTTDDVIDFLSYNTPIKTLLTFTGLKNTSAGAFDPTLQVTDVSLSPIVYVKSYPFGGNKGLFNNVLVIPKPYPSDTTFTVAQYDALSAALTPNSLIKTFGTDTINDSSLPNDFVKIDNIVDTGSSLELQLSTPLHVDTAYENSGVLLADGPESNYILKTVAATVPTLANTFAVIEPGNTGDGILSVSALTQTTPFGQPIATAGSITHVSPGRPASGFNDASLGQAGGTYTPSTTFTGVATTGGGTGLTVNVIITGAGNVQAIGGVTVNVGGTGYDIGDTITIDGALLGGSSAGNVTIDVSTITGATYSTLATTSTGNVKTGVENATFTVQVSSINVTTITKVASGIKYQLTDVLTIDGALIGGVSGVNDITFSPATLTPVPYSNIVATGGSGYSAIFNVNYNAAGVPAVTIVQGGESYVNGEVLTLPLANLGGAPATNGTVTITGVTVGPSVSDGDLMLVQAPGYAKYFEVDSVSQLGTIMTVVVKTTGLTNGAPFYQSKYCTAGFPFDEFASYLQPSDIKVTFFDTNEAAAINLIPDLDINGNDDFGYIASVNTVYSKIVGLGQTETKDNKNNVTLFNVTTNLPINSGSDDWHIVDEIGVLAAYDIDNTSGDFKSVRIVGTATANENPFDLQTVGDLVRVTLPGGEQFYVTVDDTSSNVPTATYNGIAPTTGNSIASLATYEAYPGNKLARNIAGSLVIDGDRIKYGSGSSQYNYLNVTNTWNADKDAYTKIAYGLSGAKVDQFTANTLLNKADNTFADVNLTYDGSTIYTDGLATTNDVAIYSSLAKNLSEQIAIEAPGLYGGGKKFKLTPTNAASLEIGDYVVNNNVANPILIRVTAKVKKLDPATGLPFFEYTVLDTPLVDITSGTSKITKFAPIQKFCDRFQFTKLSGFTLTDYHLPGTPAQLEKIYGVLENTNLAVTLADKDVIAFRYIVDTFNGGLEPNMGPKQILSRLAMNRQKCLALLNAPSCAQFQNSTDPRFTELPDPAAGNPLPVLNTAYIAAGGNLSLGPSYIWGLPDEGQGAKFIGVFSPNVIIRENNKEVSIPPSADVSNNFVRKFINGEPFAIVAGPRRGVISNPKFVRMEYDYLLSDRENLEPIGVNPIVTVKNVGPMIFANQTAYQRTLSAFNNLHVRDLLITIEEAIEEILQQYLFEFNDASTRLEIRSIVETYLDTVRNAGGVYNYAVIMDDTNNTPAIIDQNFGIIDVAIEPARGIQKFINRMTILKTGTISSGGFTAA
jgi:hypothetical protein